MTVYTCETRLDLSARQARALKGSIRKWERIVKGTGADYGIDNCPLCKIYVKFPQTVFFGDCDGCPVKTVTTYSSCIGTPYSVFVRSGRRRDTALYMLDFLKSILEKAYVRKGKK